MIDVSKLSDKELSELRKAVLAESSNRGEKLKSLCTAYVNASKYSYRYDPKYLERSLKNIQLNSLYGMHPEYLPGYHFTPARRPLKALEELNRREFERIAASPIRIDVDDAIKANYSKEEIKKMVNNSFRVPGKYYWETALAYKKIIFNGPCTIILWADGTKTIAKLYEDIDKFDPEKGVAICFMKKILGHTETNKILRKATKQYVEDRKESNGDLIEKIKEAFTPMEERSKKIEKAKEDIKDAPDAIKYRLYTGEEITVSADKNIGEIFFDDTKELREF